MRTRCLDGIRRWCSGVLRRSAALTLLVAASIAASVAVPQSATAATTARVDLKVLLIGTSTTDADFTTWEAALQREGVPFDTIIASSGHTPITASTLSDTLSDGTPEGKYDGVIAASGDLLTCSTTCTSGLSSSEWSALENYEETFHVRQIDGDASPVDAPNGDGYGLSTSATGADLDGVEGTLTADGKAVFPYLNGPVLFGYYPANPAGTTTYGYESTPVSTSNFDTLLTGPNGSSLVGVYTNTAGAQQLVETFAQNETLMQAELLQHGALNWLTRGVYFGDQRNYVEMDIDDTFTPDDAWDANTLPGSIDYSDADALRMSPSDVTTATTWEAKNDFRMDQLFNYGSTVNYQADNGPDPLLAAFQQTCSTNCGPGNAETGKPYADSFGWISHTYDTPYMDVGCATENYIEAELNENTSTIAAAIGSTPGTGGLGLTETTDPSVSLGAEDPKVFVPGNHSGFANLVPGNPATVDPPILDTAAADTATTSTLPAGNYEYAITDQFTNSSTAGQSQADVTAPMAVSAGQSVKLTWQAICHAADYVIYRGYEAPGATTYTWTQLVPATAQNSAFATVSTPFSATLPDNSSGNPTSTTNVTGGGELEQTYTDDGTATGTAEAAGWSPTTDLASENATETAWEQNPYFIPALQAVGITAVGDDASKPYPTDPTDQFGYGVNETVTGTGASTSCAPVACTPAGATFLDGTAQVVPRHPINIYYNASTDYEELNEYQTLEDGSSVCGGTTCTWSDLIDQITSGMFQYMMGNDPRPSYVHQTNLLGSPPADSEGADGLPPATYTPQPGGGPDEPAGSGNPTTTGDGTLYQVLDPLLYEYNEFFAANAPDQQLTEQAIANVLAEQSAWSTLEAGSAPVTGYITTSSNQVTITNPGSAIETPLTGVPSVGSLYGGIRSGWTSIPSGSTTLTASTTWPTYGTAVPVVTTGAASAVSATTATLNGTLDGAGLSISDCHFEVGTTASYGTNVPCVGTPADGATGAVSAPLTGLEGSTTYHVRLVATNAAGTTDGNDVTFTTTTPTTTTTTTTTTTSTTSTTPTTSTTSTTPTTPTIPTPTPTPAGPAATVLSLGAPIATCTKPSACTYTPAQGVLSTNGGKKPQGTLYLETAAGKPISDAAVKISDGTHTTTVRTGSEGTASFTLTAGPSRQVTVSYAGSASYASARLTISVEDRARATIRLLRAAAGETVLAGRVIGTNGEPAKLPVKLQSLSAGGHWHTITTVHASAAGRWQARVLWPMKAHATNGRTVRFRVVVEGNPSPPLRARV